jgi:hypothetical protein
MRASAGYLGSPFWDTSQPGIDPNLEAPYSASAWGDPDYAKADYKSLFRLSRGVCRTQFRVISLCDCCANLLSETVSFGVEWCPTMLDNTGFRRIARIAGAGS